MNGAGSRAPDTIDPAPVQRSSRRQNRAAGRGILRRNAGKHAKHAVCRRRSNDGDALRADTGAKGPSFCSPRHGTWDLQIGIQRSPELGESFHASRGRQVEGKHR